MSGETELADGMVMIWSTAPTRAEAETIARTLVEERLAACVQLDAIDSCFRWNGAVRMEPEMRLAIKTAAARTEAVIARLAASHSYDVPEVAVAPIVGGHAPYLAWVAVATS